MNTKRQSKMLPVRHCFGKADRAKLSFGISSCRDEKGVVLIAAIALMAILALVGVVAAVTTTTEIKISSNYNTSVQASYIARAGVEHARQELKFLNEDSTDTDSFSDELAAVVGINAALEGYTGDDVPIVDTTNLGNGSYIVYLTNDSDEEGSTNDNNQMVCLTSVATTSNGSKAVVELTVSIIELFPLPATITMLGSGAEFDGGTSNIKTFHGDDQCDADSPKPVIATSDAEDLSSIREAIQVPDTYITKDEFGNVVIANEDGVNAIITDISQSEIADIDSNYNINLLDPDDLDNLVATIKRQADTVAPDGSNDGTVDLGETGNLKVVVVTGDFTITAGVGDHGAGILVVTGTLEFHGSPTYTGLILVIGDGIVYRYSAGNYDEGILNGAILIANTNGNPTGPYYDVDGHGRGTIQYCSTAVDNAVDLLSFLKPVAVRDIR